MKRISLQIISLFATIALASATAARAEFLEAFTEPYQRVAVPAAEIGVIDEILVQEGDTVSRKQVLAKLDDDVLQSSLKVAAAAKDAMGTLRSAESDLTMREKQLESYRELHGQGNATQRELDRAENEYQQAASRLQSVREEQEVRRLEYERVKAQIRRRVIDSPINGVVVAIDKEAGEFVSPTDPVVMHVVHLETLKSVFSVPLNAAGRLSPGQQVELTLGYQQTPAEGVIEFVSPVADAESGTVRVKVRIPNRQGQLQSGVTCRWNLQVQAPVERASRKPNGSRSTR